MLSFLGADPSTKFGLIEMNTWLMPNWILGAVQKPHVQQRFRRTAPARLTRLLKSERIEKSDSYCDKQEPLLKSRNHI